jgi:trans-AT polyketide synthase/acyltransferase/oxidoreductase domain-containing protein
VWRETRGYLVEAFPERVEAIENNPKQKMAMIFRWYFIHTTRLALNGSPGKVDYQIHCGPALGAFNQWVEKTELKNWRNRKVADIGIRLMDAAAARLAKRFAQLSNEES